VGSLRLRLEEVVRDGVDTAGKISRFLRLRDDGWEVLQDKLAGNVRVLTMQTTELAAKTAAHIDEKGTGRFRTVEQAVSAGVVVKPTRSNLSIPGHEVIEGRSQTRIVLKNVKENGLSVLRPYWAGPLSLSVGV
jgi:hypothetical protein